MLAFSFTSLALWANLSVERVYWMLLSLSATVAIRNVLEFPLNESLSTNVSLESLNGMWGFDLSLLKQLITIPNVVRDLFMFPASFSLYPMAAVLFCLYEPAKSTKWILDLFIILIPFSICLLCTLRLKIACDLDDSLFMSVSPTCLVRTPWFRSDIPLSAVYICSSVNPSMNTPLRVSYRMASFLSLFKSNKSNSC